MDNDALVKAKLILGGDVVLPEGFDDERLDHIDGRPVSGVFTFGNTMVRKRISETGEFQLNVTDDGMEILHEGKPFLEGVRIKQMFCHSPDIAVISLGKKGRTMDTTEAVDLLKKYANEMDLAGISLHGGADCSEEHYVEVLKEFRSICPDTHIGVARTTEGYDLEHLKNAGADNFKTTCTSFVPRICDVLGIDHQEKLESLKQAVRVFGKGNVVTTTYIGLGETDEEIENVIEMLCSNGIMPDVKVVKAKVMIKEMESKMGKLIPTTPERYARIATILKNKMESYGLKPDTYTTMCYGCRLCTLVPFKDF